MVPSQRMQIPVLLLRSLLFLSGLEPYLVMKDPVHQVTRIAGQGASFPVNVTSGKTVWEIVYDMYPDSGGAYQLANFRDGFLNTSNPMDAERLEMADPTTLRIKALHENETGALKVEVRYSTSEIELFLFKIVVSGPQNADSTEVPKSNPPQEEWKLALWALASVLFIILAFFLCKACNRRKSTQRQEDTEEGNHLERLPAGTHPERNGYSSPERDLQTPMEDQVGGNEGHPFLHPFSSNKEEQEQPHWSSEDMKVAMDGTERSHGFVEGGSLPRGTEARVRRRDKRSQSMCCLPGAEIRDVKEKLTTCVKRADRRSFHSEHMGTNGTTRPSLQDFTSDDEGDDDDEALGRKLKDQDAGTLTPLLFPLEGKEARSMEANGPRN
ncbi:uncharacterized protein LOC121915771 isoform X1 [Sceloporus undulatus]|uniref:uncharacterized protein LOC121915771 isoform X1 n=1 Tax=Sceloporus undulatus TaxID=8520 RepID=UPI001C4C8E03|nr:uncharacterized protein LOC121915771 isoform X1 [Sceloporus undulatus]